MKPAFFASLKFLATTVDEVFPDYLGWILGVGKFPKLRRRRLESGIPPGWTVASRLNPGDFTGQNDCALAVRRGDNMALLKWVHRDDYDGSILWHNMIHLGGDADGVLVQHCTARTAPRDVVLPHITASPSVLNTLISDYASRGIRPRDMYSTALRPYEDDDSTSRFVEHVLLDGARTSPIVIVTARSSDDRLLVVPEDLAKLLRGMAVVAVLPTRVATNSLTRTLVRRGYDKRFSCFDGGVRVYLPGLSATDPLHHHYLWLGDWIEQLGNDRPSSAIAGHIAARLIAETIPRGFMLAVQDFDRDERRRYAESVLAKKLLTSTTAAAPSMEQIAERDDKIAELERALRGSIDMQNVTEAFYNDVQAEYKTAKDQIARLEFETEQESQRCRDLASKLDEAKAAKTSTAMPADARQSLDALLNDDANLEDMLRIVALTYGDRSVVLATAWKSAAESSEFKYPGDALSLLKRLLTGYWQALLDGKGDGEARKVFTIKEFSSGDSESVENNKTAKRLRTFSYKGQDVTMWAHLKHGVKDSLAETLRIHFHWDAVDKRIVIGHCGRHLNQG